MFNLMVGFSFYLSKGSKNFCSSPYHNKLSQCAHKYTGFFSTEIFSYRLIKEVCSEGGGASSQLQK